MRSRELLEGVGKIIRMILIKLLLQTGSVRKDTPYFNETEEAQ